MAQTYEVTDSAHVDATYGAWTLPRLKEALVQRGLSATATLEVFYDSRRNRLALEWSSATSAPRFREAHITVTIQGETILDLDLGGQRFPPTPDGTLAGLEGFTQGNLKVKLSFSMDGNVYRQACLSNPRR